MFQIRIFVSFAFRIRYWLSINSEHLHDRLLAAVAVSKIALTPYLCADIRKYCSRQKLHVHRRKLLTTSFVRIPFEFVRSKILPNIRRLFPSESKRLERKRSFF